MEVPQAWDLGSPRFGHGVLKGLEQVPKDGEWGSPSGYPMGVPKVMRCGSLGPCLKVLESGKSPGAGIEGSQGDGVPQGGAGAPQSSGQAPPLTLARCCSSWRISCAFCSTCSAPRRVSSRSMKTRYAARICAKGQRRECHQHRPLAPQPPSSSPSRSPHPAPGRGSVRAASAHPGQSGGRWGQGVRRGWGEGRPPALSWLRTPLISPK